MPLTVASGRVLVSEKVKRIDESSSLYRAETARIKSRAYLEKCLQEITYLLKPPSHPPPPPPPPPPAPPQQQQQQQQQLDAQMLSQQQQTQFGMYQQQQHLPQHPLPSPNHQPPTQPNHELTQSGPMRSQSAQSLRSHQPSFQQERVVPAQPQIATPSMSPTEATGKLPYGSLRRKETNPFSAAAGTEMAGQKRREQPPAESPQDNDDWDFDSSDPDPATSDRPAAEEEGEPIEFGSLGHRTNSVNSHRRKLSLSKRRQLNSAAASRPDSAANFKVKFALRGHLDAVRAVVFTGGGTASEPEICTAGDDSVLKRWTLPGTYGLSLSGVLDVDVTSQFTHRGHVGIVTSLAAYPGNFADGGGGGGGGGGSGGASGWVFSGGQDATVKVWEAGKVEPVATLVGHTDTVWAVCVLPSASAILGSPDERIFIASGSSDGTVKIWSVSAPPTSQSPRRPSPLASNASSLKPIAAAALRNGTPEPAFEYSLVSTISRPGLTASPTCITPMSVAGETFIVSYDDASVIIYDTETSEQVVSMASQETYDGTPATGVSSIVATTMSLEPGEQQGKEPDEVMVAGATGGQRGGVGGVIITGHEDQYVRIFDANSGKSRNVGGSSGGGGRTIQDY